MASAEAFVFDERPCRVQVSDRVMLEALRRLSDLRGGGGFRMCDFDSWEGRPCKATTIMQRFDGWRRAQRKAGIKFARRGKYTAGELMEILEEVWRELERPPGHPALKKIGKISTGAYVRHWGTLAHACRRLAMFHRGEISREELETPDHKGSPARWLKPGVRWAVLKRDGERCVVCGRSGSEQGVRLEVDHVVAVSRGGGDEMSNLRTLCRECNRGKGAR